MKPNSNTKMQEIANRFVEERHRLGWSQRNLAHVLNISREGLRKNENAKTVMTSTTLAAAATLGFDVQYIFSGIKSINIQDVEKSIFKEVHHG
ncbi:hypothetical protein [Acinetobacter sp. CFCC 10889]|uniref:hypothetical protein n=1 Tax=Acinetobacter sp. CFCC 10889 TaxID=1775557 RepID=UPI000DD025C5|nr:hypothetical protein [Acinetobacter sp. CFCC 10889]